MFAHLLARQRSPWLHLISQGCRDHFLSYSPGILWTSSRHPCARWHRCRAQGALQHSQPADSCHTSVQNQPQTPAPAWMDRRIHLERALVILGSGKPRAGVHTPLGARGWQSPKDTEKFRLLPSRNTSMFISRDGVWEAGNRRVPGHLFLPVLFLADSLQLLV